MTLNEDQAHYLVVNDQPHQLENDDPRRHSVG